MRETHVSMVTNKMIDWFNELLLLINCLKSRHKLQIRFNSTIICTQIMNWFWNQTIFKNIIQTNTESDYVLSYVLHKSYIHLYIDIEIVAKI